ncbi:uncharacterized protein N7469_000074 [Penicillium citrinum]|uniref:Uncharacterized protein n=1 Tax=Penicillium citrinum TaxID=5077 RepID=A0A9W9TUD3_PENCI|nr:uncharacterized protein N7469_000074 [Penicillium citrinum]KAJ5241747.1 hypothetical protein N7469_000074 [Penicillium citrinum]
MIRFGITTEILSHCLSYLPPKNIHCHYTYITLIWRLPNTTLDRDLGSQLQVGGSNDLKRAAFLESSLDYSQLKTKRAETMFGPKYCDTNTTKEENQRHHRNINIANDISSSWKTRCTTTREDCD